MFISEELAEQRIKSSENLLRSVNKSERVPSAPPNPEPPVIEPELVLEDEDHTCDTAQNCGAAPTPNELAALLNMKRRRYMTTQTQASVALFGSLTSRAAAARLFGCSSDHAEDLNKGFTNPLSRELGKHKEELVDEIKRQSKDVRDLAFSRLTKSLTLMTDDMLGTVTDPTKLARVSRDLSTVLDKVMPKEDSVQGGVHFHVWRPEMREEASYETVVVGSQQ